MPFSNVILIIMFVVPGFIANRIYGSYYAGIKDSDFGRIVSSIIYSIICLLITTGLFALCGGKFSFDTDGKSITLTQIVVLIAVSYLYGFALIGIEKFKRKYFPGQIKEQSTWAHINSVHKNSWVVVHLKNGDKFLGWIRYWKFDPNSPCEFDLFISDVDKVDEKLTVEYHLNGPGLYVISTEVSHIEYLN